MDMSKSRGGVRFRLINRIAIIILGFTAMAGIAFALFTYAPEKHLQHITETVKTWEAPFSPTESSKCRAFHDVNKVWRNSQLKYQHLRDDKFTYVSEMRLVVTA